MTRTTELSGWGRYPRRPGHVIAPRHADDLASVAGQKGLVARGNGRAYGDSAIGAATTVDMRAMNRMLAFDATRGQLVAEAGVLLGDIIAAFLPRGWFLNVSPGTKFVSLGGAIAADVHGKNHHIDGSFGAFVDWIEIMDQHGQVQRVSREENAETFAWTIGGMGLTGIILRAAIRLRAVQSGWIRQNTIVAPNLAAAMATFDDVQDATYSVAWIDCLASGQSLGRSLVMTGEHEVAEALPRAHRQRPLHVPKRANKTFPFDAPGFALNALSVKAFNAAYWAKGCRSAGETLIDWDTFFYPLDAILGWNRIYGRRGFMQFQCVLPLATAEAGLTALLRETASTGQGSFLAVLKRFGAQTSKFSFPMEGYTLALDFPATPRTLALLDKLDHITVAHGGRFYLAKDARMAASTLHAADPRTKDLTQMRDAGGLRDHFASAQSKRLLL